MLRGMETVANSSEIALGCPNAGAKKRRNHRATKPQLLTREALDKRTNACKLFDRVCADIEADLGGRDQLSTIELQLIEAFAGAAVTLSDLNCRIALGQGIEPGDHALAVSAMVRVASRLGLSKRARDVTPSLSDYLQQAAE
jgi:hypothetical protein